MGVLWTEFNKVCPMRLPLAMMVGVPAEEAEDGVEHDGDSAEMQRGRERGAAGGVPNFIGQLWMDELVAERHVTYGYSHGMTSVVAQL